MDDGHGRGSQHALIASPPRENEGGGGEGGGRELEEVSAEEETRFRMMSSMRGFECSRNTRFPSLPHFQ